MDQQPKQQQGGEYTGLGGLAQGKAGGAGGGPALHTHTEPARFSPKAGESREWTPEQTVSGELLLPRAAAAAGVCAPR